MQQKIKILIVDDHEVVSHGLKTILNMVPELEVVEVYNIGRDAVENVDSIDPDVILMDIHMPEMNGFEASGAILQNDPERRIIILSMENIAGYMKKAKSEGLMGYVTKGADLEYLVSVIKRVHAGEKCFDELIEYD